MNRRRRNTPASVLARLAERGGAPDQCWEWPGARDTSGYGVVRINGRQLQAHRVVLQAATGQKPGELVVRHSCDNPPCCNPAHLLLGTALDNAQDAVSRGRHAHGSTHGHAKLTEDEVAEIRRRAAHESHASLALRYGVTRQNIGLIVNGQTWRTAA